MTREEIEALTDAAAEKAVNKCLLAFGINSNDPLKAQAMFLHLERQYESCQTIKQHGLKTAIGVVVTAMAAYVLLIFGFRQH